MSKILILSHLESLKDWYESTSSWSALGETKKNMLEEHLSLWLMGVQESGVWLDVDEVMPISQKQFFPWILSFYEQAIDSKIEIGVGKIIDYFLKGWVEIHWLTPHPNAQFLERWSNWSFKDVFLNDEKFLQWRIQNASQKLMTNSSRLAYVSYVLRAFERDEWFQLDSSDSCVFKEVFRSFWQSSQNFQKLQVYEKLIKESGCVAKTSQERRRWLSLLQIGLGFAKITKISSDPYLNGLEKLTREYEKQGLGLGVDEVDGVWSEYCFPNFRLTVEDCWLNLVMLESCDSSPVTHDHFLAWGLENKEVIHQLLGEMDLEDQIRWHECVLEQLSATCRQKWVLGWLFLWNHGAWITPKNKYGMMIKEVLEALKEPCIRHLVGQMDRALQVDFSQTWKEIYFKKYAFSNEEEEKDGEGRSRRRL